MNNDTAAESPVLLFLRWCFLGGTLLLVAGGGGDDAPRAALDETADESVDETVDPDRQKKAGRDCGTNGNAAALNGVPRRRSTSFP